MRVKFADICTITSSKRIFESEYVDNGIPFIRGQEISDGSILDENASFECYISQERYNELKSKYYVPSFGDILITAVGTIGNLCYIDKPRDFYFKDGNVILFTAFSENVYSKYLFYYMKSPMFKKQLEYAMIGAVQKALTMVMLNKIVIDLPDIETQKTIVAVLDKIDSKISTNNRINAELESMANTIYDYWFTQFDFPDENGKPYKSSGGKMVWNEKLKREIPEGWRVNNILDVCNIIDCLHSKKPDYYFESESAYLLTLENLTKDGHVDIAKKYYVSISDYYEWTSRIEIQENDFVVTNAGRAGDICKIPSNVKCAIGRNITAIRPTNINPYFLEMFFKSSLVREQIMGNLDCGSFFMSFNVKSIKKLHILTPPDKIIDDCCKTFQDISKKIEANIIENQQLASLRDWLLPMLMNGQVGFEGVEKQR